MLKLNRNQRIVIGAAMVIVLVMMLYPPWIARSTGSEWEPRCGWFWRGPFIYRRTGCPHWTEREGYSGWKRTYEHDPETCPSIGEDIYSTRGKRIHIGRLFAQFATVIFLTAGALVLLKE